MANPTSGARNPGFDVTPPELITGIITPAGIFKPQELWKRRRELGFGKRKSKEKRNLILAENEIKLSIPPGGVAKW